ncbi:phosphatidylglycerol:prolipoprotein diacylglycerol transferase [Pedobacter sp. UYP30]|uniref:prolipoprotein diacylglyceryl transferase n=1 Tax=Pedobacter sp. UYP30 TaxID=1756400 RepID=UPI00339745E5
MILEFIHWNPNENLFDLGFYALRYYSLLFMLAFLSSYLVLRTQFICNTLNLEMLDKLTIYVFLGTLIGARLGHCFFYDFAYFSKHPLEIILPVQFSPNFKFLGFRGLASHGGGIGILISLILFSRKYKVNLWFVLDQVALVVPLAGFFIRMGNLMNSEIIGKPTSVSWAFIFEQVDQLPRHPTQIYEGLCYLLIFLALYFFVINKTPTGITFGCCITSIFVVRFLVEFFKENQVAFENSMSLNMGQLLSIPFILFGLTVVIWLYRKNRVSNFKQ